jgi:hypothetical protein
MTAVMTRDEPNGWLHRLGTIEKAPQRPAGGRDAHDAVMDTLYALATGEAAYAKRTSYLAASLDDDGDYAGLTSVVERAVADIETAGTVQTGTWDRLTTIIGDGPLSALVERVRTS